MSERQMTIILLCVMGGIILAGGALLYYFQFVDLAEKEQILEVVKKDVAEATRKKNEIPNLEAKKKRLLESIERIRSQIPVFSPKDENDQFAVLVGDTLRKKTRVAISGARFTPARAGEPLPPTIFRARYELKVTGGFYQLLNYLNHLETERRFLVADNIKLSAGTVAEKGGQAAVRELSMNLSTFLQRPSPVAATPAAKPGEKPAEAPPPEETKRLSTPIPD